MARSGCAPWKVAPAARTPRSTQIDRGEARTTPANIQDWKNHSGGQQVQLHMRQGQALDVWKASVVDEAAHLLVA